ncbi:hypothetical protein [Vreelandella andesensis]|nr:hypothetical protein [Halomonas andesensis]
MRINGNYRAVSIWEKKNGEWVLVQDARTWALHELEWEDDNFWGGLE